MDQPLVSVFLPTYNHVSYVRESILSIVEQDYPNLQVVVSDDGSTDGTRDVVAGLAAQYPDRITLLLGEHRGLAGNCNRVLDACRGAYIAFCAGDDLFLPGKIRRQVEWFEQDRGRMICGHDIDVFESETGEVLFRWSDYFPIPKTGRGASRLVRVGCVFPGPSLMTRASAIAGIRYDDRFGLMCDWKFWIDVFADSGGYYGSIEGVLARYRRHAASVTSDDRTFDGRMTDVLMTLGMVEATRPAFIRECRYYRAKIFLKLGGRRLMAGDRDGGRSYLFAALRSSALVSWKVPAALLLAALPGTISQRVLRRYVTPTKI